MIICFSPHVYEEVFCAETANGHNIMDLLNKYQQVFSSNISRLSKTPSINGSPRIPLITHHIWLTDKDNPQDMEPGFIKFLKETANVLRQDHGWSHHVWLLNNNELEIYFQRP